MHKVISEYYRIGIQSFVRHFDLQLLQFIHCAQVRFSLLFDDKVEKQKLQLKTIGKFLRKKCNIS